MDRSSPSLPSKLVRNSQHVIHTVGPIANGNPTNPHRAQLSSCYQSCLDLAGDCGLSSIAFCCISTGVFGFPQEEAARIAVQTVRGWLLDSSSPITVVFNVFSSVDYEIYADLLGI
jgi:macro domain protein